MATDTLDSIDAELIRHRKNVFSDDGALADKSEKEISRLKKLRATIPNPVRDAATERRDAAFRFRTEATEQSEEDPTEADRNAEYEKAKAFQMQADGPQTTDGMISRGYNERGEPSEGNDFEDVEDGPDAIDTSTDPRDMKASQMSRKITPKITNTEPMRENKENTGALVTAIAAKSAMGVESSFKTAMSGKVLDAINDRRPAVLDARFDAKGTYQREEVITEVKLKHRTIEPNPRHQIRVGDLAGKDRGKDRDRYDAHGEVKITGDSKEPTEEEKRSMKEAMGDEPTASSAVNHQCKSCGAELSDGEANEPPLYQCSKCAGRVNPGSGYDGDGGDTGIGAGGDSMVQEAKSMRTRRAEQAALREGDTSGQLDYENGWDEDKDAGSDEWLKARHAATDATGRMYSYRDGRGVENHGYHSGHKQMPGDGEDYTMSMRNHRDGTLSLVSGADAKQAHMVNSRKKAELLGVK